MWFIPVSGASEVLSVSSASPASRLLVQQLLSVVEQGLQERVGMGAHPLTSIPSGLLTLSL